MLSFKIFLFICLNSPLNLKKITLYFIKLCTIIIFRKVSIALLFLYCFTVYVYPTCLKSVQTLINCNSKYLNFIVSILSLIIFMVK